MQSLKDPVRPPRISVTQSLMLLIRSSIDLADSVNAMLWAALCAAWFGFLYVSDFYLSIVRLRPSRASLSQNCGCQLPTPSVCHAALHQGLRDWSFPHRGPTPPSAPQPRGPAFPTSSITVAAFQALCVSSRMVLPHHTPLPPCNRRLLRHPRVGRSQTVQPHLLAPLAFQIRESEL